MANTSLDKAKKAKDNEFYTRYDDIQAELNHYRDQFRGKIVYCNCDDPAESAFSDFFKLNFDHYGLKKLICTRYVKSDLFTQAWLDPMHRVGYRIEITGKDKCEKIDLREGGDFRSAECIELLKEADIVCTNPPFSLFREYIQQLVQYQKKFLIIGNKNAITYKEVFPLLANNKVWLGYTVPNKFVRPDGTETTNMSGLCRWWTNLDTTKRHEDMILYESYTPERFPRYDNYDAIEVDKVKSIPKDFFGVMGVPITFLDNYNPEQFEILGLLQSSTDEQAGIPNLRYYGDFKEMRQDLTYTGASGNKANGNPVLSGKSARGNFLYNEQTKEYVHSVYARITIRRKESK